MPAGQAPWSEISVRSAVRVTTARARPVSPAVGSHQEGGGAPATLALVVASCCSRPHSLTSRDRLSCLLPCGRLSRAHWGIEAEGAGNDGTPEDPPSGVRRDTLRRGLTTGGHDTHISSTGQRKYTTGQERPWLSDAGKGGTAMYELLTPRGGMAGGSRWRSSWIMASTSCLVRMPVRASSSTRAEVSHRVERASSSRVTRSLGLGRLALRPVT